MDMSTQTSTTGQILKALRQRQKLSQEALALAADSSSRYLSFIETGRAHPSRSLLLKLAKVLQSDEQVCNDLLISAGYSPLQPTLAPKEVVDEVRSTLSRLINSSDHPAVITDRYGNILAYNAIMAATIETLLGSSDYLDSPIANIHMLELDPGLCRPYIVNLAQQENDRLTALRHTCFRNPDDDTFRELYDQLQQFKTSDPATEPDESENSYFSRLHLKKGSRDIKIYWFYGAIGSHASQLCEEIQVISGIPADVNTERLFQQLANKSRHGSSID